GNAMVFQDGFNHAPLGRWYIGEENVLIRGQPYSRLQPRDEVAKSGFQLLGFCVSDASALHIDAQGPQPSFLRVPAKLAVRTTQTDATWSGKRKAQASFDFLAHPVDPPLGNEVFDAGVLTVLAVTPVTECFYHRRGHGDRLFPVYPG